MHGGSVNLESEVGKGSKFTIILPCATPKSTSKNQQQEISKSSFSPQCDSEKETPIAGNYQILIADDNQANIDTIFDYLELQGYELIIAKNGLEAIEMAKNRQPQLILMDIQMPKMDGLEAIRRIRSEEKNAKIPIIAVTALAMAGDREKCLEVGANDYLSKPFSLKNLSDKIKGYLSCKYQQF